jgi:acetyl esterase/lipase
MSLASPPVVGSTFDRVEETTADNLTVRGEWVRAPLAQREDGVVLYLHGSGYAVCSSRTHRGLTSQISAGTGLPIFSIDYRLAPTAQFPAAQDDVRVAWDWLIAQGHDPSRIVVAGDSAGGHLALTLVLELAREGAEVPAAIVALSPVVDLSMAAGLVRDRIEHDPFASARVARRTVGGYVREEWGNERLRIEFDDLDGFPPTLVHAGSREMLAADCTELVRRLSGAGFDVEYRVWPGLMHVFQAMTRVMPESKAALAEISAFIGLQLPGTSARPDLKVVAIA